MLHLSILFPSVVAFILTSFPSSCFHLLCSILSPLFPTTCSLFLFLFASFFLSHLSHCLLFHLFFLSFSFLAFFPHTSSIVSYNRSISSVFFLYLLPSSFSPLQLTHCFLSPLYFSICSFFLYLFPCAFPFTPLRPRAHKPSAPPVHRFPRSLPPGSHGSRGARTASPRRRDTSPHHYAG